MSSRCLTITLALGLAGALGSAAMAKGAKDKGGDNGELPAIKISASNPMPACATPGRLMAFLKARNDKLDPRYSTIAADYMRHGQALDVRWDFAFFQMMLETGNLSYKNGSRPGDVRIKQNNFAGIGATGGSVAGETFPDVSTGVKAHIEHLRLYAADPVANPVADRTRKVMEWRVLDRWQKSMGRPVNFRDLASRWAANASYARDIQSVSSKFFEDHCNKPDPQPELMVEAKMPPPATKTAAAADDDDDDKPSGKKLAKRAGERGRKEGQRRAALGGLGKRGKPAPEADAAADDDAKDADTDAKKAVAKPQVTLINPPGGAQPKVADKPAAPQPASAATATKPGAPAAGTATGKCRVWTASYGGQKAIIIKSVTDGITNYTVLDVNEGAEKREADAYIKAYAKGGELVLEFPNQTAALDKAFELCPEG